MNDFNSGRKFECMKKICLIYCEKFLLCTCSIASATSSNNNVYAYRGKLGELRRRQAKIGVNRP